MISAPRFYSSLEKHICDATSIQNDLRTFSHDDKLEQFRKFHKDIFHLKEFKNSPQFSTILSLFQSISADLNNLKTRDINALLDFMIIYRRPAAEVIKVLKYLQNIPNFKIDRYTAFSVLRGLTEDGDIDNSMKLIESLKSSAAFEVDISFYDLIIRAYLQRALATYSKKQSFSTDYENVDLQNATKLGLELIENSRVQVDSKFISSYMIAYGKMKNPKGCLYWLDLAHKLKLKPLTPLYNSLLQCYSRIGDTNAALACLDKMSASRNREILWPNSYTFGNLIRMFISRDMSLDVVQIFDTMKTLDVKIDVETFNVLLWNSAKNGNVRKVEEYFQSMKKMGLKPDIYSYNSRIIARATQNQIRPFSQNYFKLLRSKRGNTLLDKEAYSEILDIYEESTKLGLMPNSKTINTLLLCAWFRNDIAKVFDIYKDAEQILQSSPIIQIAQTKKRKEDLFMDALHPNTIDGRDSTVLLDVDTFNYLIVVHISCGEFEKAKEILEIKMPQFNVLPNQWTLALLLRHTIDHGLHEDTSYLVNYLKHWRQSYGVSKSLVFDKGVLDSLLYEIRRKVPKDLGLHKGIDWLRSGKKIDSKKFHRKKVNVT